MVTPLFCCSHTVSGDCKIVFETSTASAMTSPSTLTATITDGAVLWTDPLYGYWVNGSDTPSLVQRLAYQMDAVDGSDTYGALYSGANNKADVRQAYIYNGGTRYFRFRLDSSTSTTAGRLVARRLGIRQTANDPATGTQEFYSKAAFGIWSPDRGEAGDIDTEQAGRGYTRQAFDGTLYTTQIGDPTHRRTVTLRGLPSSYARRRGAPADLSLSVYDHSFESYIWPWLARGELLRYYADGSATKTYVTNAVTSAENTISVFSNDGLSTNTSIWVDGERMTITGISGTTITVFRDNPRAHVKYAPVSTAFVGTFAIDDGGGNVNRSGYRPARRGLDDDRFDLEISLVQGRMP